MAFDLCRSFSLLVVIGLLVGNSLSNAHEIPPDEVEALKIISAKLNNRYWGNISQESCIDGGESFNRTIISTEVFSNVICDCSFNNDTCHVTTIQMKGLNLSGVLPAELANLTHLQEIDLSRNYLSGSIPSSLAKLPLVILALGGNRISGTIPEELSQISTLENITVESNLLGGPLPPALGNLNRLRRFHISGNNFSEAIPESFGNLKNLTQLLTDGNTLSGKIPQFIGNWTKIQTLDLSFNMLTGQIPSTMQNLANLKFMLLTNNSLSGPVPGWILGTKHNFDVSYNNFTGLAPYDCQQSSNLNLVSSFSTTKSNSTNWCSKKDLPCPSEPKYDSLFVNCGGPKMSYNRHEYEADTTPGGASNFYASGSPNWAYSSTGVYLDNDNANFTASNKFQLNVMSPEYYQTARLAPLSLKYYGVCLKKGSYNVQLHFAEIMFSYDDTYSRLGRRYFNVEIQGNLVLKNFDIAKEAGGVEKGITKTFPDVHVNGSTLEIHLYRARLKTTSILDRGVYGPLISAITVTPSFKTGTRLSVRAISGIVIGSIAVIALLLVALSMKGYLGGKRDENEDYQWPRASYFSLRRIKAATNDFNSKNKIGEGGFGPVYKGVLADGTVIAVKQLSSKSKQGNREFVNEMGTISALQHPNLVKLYGCCVEGKELLLVYEYMENNSLARALFGHEEHRIMFNWPTRKKICLGIARGLAYLHEESRLKIVHRDIKATNVLLDKDLNAKISDFGLAKLDEEENSHISTRIAGTIGYMAPEYATRGYLTGKADVYSFGVVVLEIVSAKNNTNYRPTEAFVYLLDWAYVLQEQGNLLDLVDPNLGSNYSEEEALRMLNLALLCTNPSPSLRPTMSSVVSMIEGRAPVQAPIVKQNALGETGLRFKSLERLSHDSRAQVSMSSTSSQVQRSSISMDGPALDSMVSIQSNE